MFFKISLIVIGITCIISTLLPLAKGEAWWIRIFDFPRVQILAIAATTIALYFTTGTLNVTEGVFLTTLFGSVIYQAVRIFPYTSLHRLQVTKAGQSIPEREITFYITNVYMDNRNSALCINEIKKASPDVVLALETDSWWEQELRKIENEYPYTVKVPLPNTYGMTLYSKLKLSDTKVKYLVEQEIPSIHTLIELKSGEKIMFYGVHPKPPAPGESNSSLPRDAELILVAKDSRTQKYPVIVAGDLNDVAWSHTTHLFQKISGLLDPRVGRGMFSTFNSKYFLLRWPLDHVFHSDHFQIINMERIAHINSDHFPICVKLCYNPLERDLQDAPEATYVDKKEALEKVQEAVENN